MSEKPVAMWMVEVDGKPWNAWPKETLANVYASGFSKPPKIVPGHFSTESPAEVRALAIAECARAVGECRVLVTETDPVLVAKETSESLAQQLRALSPAPSVTEEWVEKRLKEAYSMPGPTPHAAVRATLAALGVKVEGAAK